MKYMGSKQALLHGRLGALLIREVRRADRFIDLFSGSAAVAGHIASQLAIPVIASDLQRFAVVLAADKVERTRALSLDEINRKWIDPAETMIRNDSRFDEAARASNCSSRNSVMSARKLCAERPGEFFWTDYGGHYFSPIQSLMFDALHRCLPDTRSERNFALAALINAASRCAAAPGHTAQPFQPTNRLLPFIAESWKRQPLDECRQAIVQSIDKHALCRGFAIQADARCLSSELRSGDVVFIDPPYSAVQYSRFYHVLEAIAIGGFSKVTGAGRAPDLEMRQRSSFSLRSAAMSQFGELLRRLRETSANLIVTFPDAEASNGMSARSIIAASQNYFKTDVTRAAVVHSTLGGGPSGRAGRRRVDELILVMRPC